MFLTQLDHKKVIFTNNPSPCDIRKIFGENVNYDQLHVEPIQVIDNQVGVY